MYVWKIPSEENKDVFSTINTTIAKYRFRLQVNLISNQEEKQTLSFY